MSEMKLEDKAPRRTDGDDTETHGGGILDSKMSESSSSTGESDPVSDLGLGVLDGTVDGDTLKKCKVIKMCERKIERYTNSAEDGSSLETVEVLGNGGNMVDP